MTEVKAAAAGCSRCDLYARASQTVFGEGPAGAALMLIGETPGDQEDRAGHVFTGPAGRVLDRALADSGIRRDQAYLTNAVKHFKWTARGKRRIHERPNTSEIKACRPWLEDELRLVRPRLIVLLGAVAGESVFGSGFRVGTHKGLLRPAALGEWTGQSVATIHPSAVLRGPDAAARDTLYEGLVADLRTAREAAGHPRP